MELSLRTGEVILDPEGSTWDARLLALIGHLQPAGRVEVAAGSRWRLKVMTRRNLAVWCLIVTWALYYFTFQFHSSQKPRYLSGGLFSCEPMLWLQDHRLTVLDHFLAYSWVVLFIATALLYFVAAIASGREFYRYGLAFWVPWLVQYCLQMTVNLASPIRDPDSGLEFIRQEVFPLSEHLVGVKYGAFPSGHIGVTLLVLLMARERELPWLQCFAAFSLAVMTLAVFYLGEHYPADVLASLALYPTLFFATLRVTDRMWERPGRTSCSQDASP